MDVARTSSLRSTSQLPTTLPGSLARVPNGRATLETIAKGAREPDRSIAAGLLGVQGKTIIARLSQVDDSARLLVNGVQVLATANRDTGWVDISGALRPGENRLDFSLDNGPFGGWGARFQLSSGQHEFDEAWVENACPCNAKVLDVNVRVTVGAGGEIVSLAAGSPRYY